MGHHGFYLKSASGRLDPKFVYILTSNLYDKFPDQNITIHAHSTYGRAPACYIAAAMAATERGRIITMDVQHPALSGSTSQPSMNKMIGLIRNHPDKKINSNANCYLLLCHSLRFSICVQSYPIHCILQFF